MEITSPAVTCGQGAHQGSKHTERRRGGASAGAGLVDGDDIARGELRWCRQMGEPLSRPRGQEGPGAAATRAVGAPPRAAPLRRSSWAQDSTALPSPAAARHCRRPPTFSRCTASIILAPRSYTVSISLVFMVSLPCSAARRAARGR